MPRFPRNAVAYAAAGFLVTAGGGALLTRIDRWYRSLRKPSWQPPDGAFGPAWTIIFLLTAWSFLLSWQQLSTAQQRARLGGVYGLNAGLNALWTYLFFTRRRPDLALLEAGPLLGSIALLMATTAPLDKRATAALSPYLIWVSFATVLNASIVRMNPAQIAAARGADARR